jgi:lysozyme family protein
MSITLTPKLKKEYEDLFTSCVINQVRQKDVEKIRDKIGLRCKKYFEMRKPCGSISLCSTLEEALDKLRLAHHIISD